MNCLQYVVYCSMPSTEGIDSLLLCANPDISEYMYPVCRTSNMEYSS